MCEGHQTSESSLSDETTEDYGTTNEYIDTTGARAPNYEGIEAI